VDLRASAKQSTECVDSRPLKSKAGGETELLESRAVPQCIKDGLPVARTKAQGIQLQVLKRRVVTQAARQRTGNKRLHVWVCLGAQTKPRDALVRSQHVGECVGSGEFAHQMPVADVQCTHVTIRLQRFEELLELRRGQLGESCSGSQLDRHARAAAHLAQQPIERGGRDVCSHQLVASCALNLKRWWDTSSIDSFGKH